MMKKWSMALIHLQGRGINGSAKTKKNKDCYFETESPASLRADSLKRATSILWHFSLSPEHLSLSPSSDIWGL